MTDDDEDVEYVTAPPPPLRVIAHLKGGPHDGETRHLPWARLRLPVMTWDDDTPTESVYLLGQRWLGQRDVDYRFEGAETDPVVSIGRPRARRAQRALLAARDAWRKAA